MIVLIMEEVEMKEKLKKIFTDKQNLVIIALVIIIVLLIFIIIKVNDKEENTLTDAQKFSREYTEVEEDNLYVYRSYDEIINILENGTGVILLGFPECPWCQRYAKYLNEVAKELDFDKIYYYNILEDRKNNTEEYQKIVSLISDYLQYDEEGNKRIYVPSIIAIDKGKIVGFDDETAWDTKGFETPDEYWDEEAVTSLKDKLETMLLKAHPDMCNSCNED